MHLRFHSAFGKLPATLQSALRPYIAAPDFPAMLTAEQTAAIRQLSGLDDDALACALLPLAAAYSLAPISHFNVGAIAQGQSGNLYFGANMEFSGVPMQQTVHAEQSAVIHAWLRGETALVAITVNYRPCGHCRQFMNELNSGAGLQIRLPGAEPTTLADHLPDAFGPKDLGIATLLMDQINHGYQLTLTDKLALAAANQSYAPYSNAHSGLALAAEDGRVYAGRYAENAAFNPSLPPLQAALILFNLLGGDCMKIRRAVLAEPQSAILSQWDMTRATLAALGCHNVSRVSF
ncbi:cytidine deaminase [Serratia symbiotica]|uniref:Cytidine deaminase n=1 Tax=Serratia symbiotica TaxID=138074 RepID=A0A068Z0M9_9GAMM|nr:cytidine deaminase [Serratia symbiotica]MBF1995080.1 cytidine deaminase [Serratia symbiotica]MBQ0956157.1 cytidine deaminase [Serratia symbiotica]QLH62997.1 cytidine deaminase [Serratia symbiotica]QTP15341.1 cytidine deaminase [Serratia symbiotica]CDS57383.1 cytidine/deoxycytidine deaminase [Serratia symbiotica]